MASTADNNSFTQADEYDVVVVGAGFGGVYGIHRFRQDGLSVLGIEGGSGVGGVWFHNRYPGARVDIDSVVYCYHISNEIYRGWKWKERYAAQPELLEYINYVADTLDLKKHILFNTWMTAGEWQPAEKRYVIKTSTGRTIRAKFLVMATGQLSEARKPPFPGLDEFKGEWVQTSHWPDREVKLAGRRIGIIGTGSSGVQAVPRLAEQARHLTVFQRSPNYSVPAQNKPLDEATWEMVGADVPAEKARLLKHFGAQHRPRGTQPASAFTPEEQQAMIEKQWNAGGHAMSAIFSDQTTNAASNELVAEFVRNKIRQTVKDPVVAEKLCPKDHPIGTRRLCLDIGYHETYNRDNVTLVDVREAPIERITATGIQTRDGKHYELDLIVFAIGFDAFKGAVNSANIRNEHGRAPTDHWDRGPQTLLGLMTSGFPNLFMVAGAGSTSVLANMVMVDEHHVDWIADCIQHLKKNGLQSIEPEVGAERDWSQFVADAAGKILRLNVNNYMVHVNKDGSRVFMPYVGGFDKYVALADASAAKGYEGFKLQ